MIKVQSQYIFYNNMMEQTFSPKEIVWAKVKGYPWWPAEIAKIATPDSYVFKVVFVAQDTHAYLNPKDVRKYHEFYDECSKKKMRGLAPAIQAADELYKKRINTLPKPTSMPSPIPKQSKPKLSPKHKPIRKYNLHKKSQQQDNSSEGEGLSESSIQISVENKKQDNEIEAQKQDSELISQQNGSQQKFVVECEQKVDRNKIDMLEEGLFRIVEHIKENTYTFNEQDYADLQTLTGDQLLPSKITNLLTHILSKLTKPTQTQETRWLKKLKDQLKQRILDHLYDTSYYDQYIKLIQKNKKNRDQYEEKLIYHLKNQYRIKKQLATLFANRLVSEINNGTISKQRQLLQDIKQHRLQVVNLNNKASIDRCVQNLIPKYM